MPRDYYKLEPDRIYRLGQHYTPGRAGQHIQFITRHHLMYIGEGEDVVNKIWNTRPASAHNVIGPTGRWVQTVYDRDTAWANASQWANQRTIAIEHSNITGRVHGSDYHPDSWNISDETIISGARVAAAYCWFFKLGRPVYGKNIRDHFEFTSTGCPVHLSGPKPGNPFHGRAGMYHQRWMDEAQRFYDELAAGRVNPDGTPKPAPTPQRKAPTVALTQKFFTDFIKGFIGPVISDVKDIRQQLTGGRDAGQYPGWSISQLVKNYQAKPGDNGTIPEMLAVTLTELQALRADVETIKKEQHR